MPALHPPEEPTPNSEHPRTAVHRSSESDTVTRAEARVRGLKRYYTGKPCRGGRLWNASRRTDVVLRA